MRGVDQGGDELDGGGGHAAGDEEGGAGHGGFEGEEGAGRIGVVRHGEMWLCEIKQNMRVKRKDVFNSCEASQGGSQG